MSDEEAKVIVKVPHMSAVDNAITDMMVEKTMGRIRGLGIEYAFDAMGLQEQLTTWIGAVLEHLHAGLNLTMQANKEATAIGYQVDFLFPRFKGDHDHHDAYLSNQAVPVLADSDARELERCVVMRLSFRLVRQSVHHAFKVVTVNMITEEVEQPALTDEEMEDAILPIDAELLPEDTVYTTGFDEIKQRPDLDEDWHRNYTLDGDEFVLGTTRVLTNIDIIHNATRFDETGEMTRTLFGLGDMAIEDVSIEGSLTIRTNEKGSRVGTGT